MDTFPPETLPADLEAKYSAFKAAWEQEAGGAFFHAHHTEEWLRSKYNPELLEETTATHRKWASAAAADLFGVVTAGADAVGGDFIDRLPGSSFIDSGGLELADGALMVACPCCVLCSTCLHSWPCWHSVMTTVHNYTRLCRRLCATSGTMYFPSIWHGLKVCAKSTGQPQA